MKSVLLALALLSFGPAALASDKSDIQACLSKWKNAPFTANSDFRVVSAKVKVMGIGQDIDESTKTSAPELVLIKPAVTVMAKTEITLGNPNGWYCLKGKTAVLGKIQINLHCKARMASSESGATVMGADDTEGTGTTVLGATRINRIGSCGDAAKN